MENIIRDYFRRQPLVSFVDGSELENVPCQDNTTPDLDDPPEDLKLTALNECFSKLESREQFVLRETALWYVPGRAHQRMPNAAMRRITQELNTTPANVRQIRRRAMAKLKARIQIDEELS